MVERWICEPAHVTTKHARNKTRPDHNALNRDIRREKTNSTITAKGNKDEGEDEKSLGRGREGKKKLKKKKKKLLKK